MVERWAAIPLWDGYFVSDRGVLRGPRAASLRGALDKNGYHCVYIGPRKAGALIKVHRAVVTAFIGPIPPGMHVNHKNGVKNDNRVENLEIVTPHENVLHGYRSLGRKGRNTNPTKGSKHHHARFSEEDIRRMRRLYRSGQTQKAIGKMFDTHQASVSRIVRGSSWSHLD